LYTPADPSSTNSFSPGVTGSIAPTPPPTGGFAVRARVPYSTQSLPVATRDTPHSEANAPDERVRWQWLDRLLAVLTLVVLERRVLSSSHIRSQLILSTVVVAAISLAVMWRRRHPVVFATSVALLDLMLIWLGPFKHTIFTICLWAWVLYTVAAWTGRRVAITLLGCIVGVFSLGQVLGTNDTNAAQFAGVLFLMCVPWGCGIAVQSRRHLTHQLERLSSQLSQEREDRARLAVASERSRIARELHAAVAGSVAAMVVQAEAAVTALDQDGRAADPIMDAIEATGRTTLAEMRRILGVLRRPGESPELEPQPGIDQIHALIRRARASGQMVQMTVEGEPGILTSGVEIGVYRILNDALAAARAKPERPVEVALTFGSDELELRIRADVNDWPTSVMRESAAMCHGKLIAHREPDGHCGLLARMPTEYQGALA
jgi:signal transduction histidine kinase